MKSESVVAGTRLVNCILDCFFSSPGLLPDMQIVTLCGNNLGSSKYRLVLPCPADYGMSGKPGLFEEQHVAFPAGGGWGVVSEHTFFIK